MYSYDYLTVLDNLAGIPAGVMPGLSVSKVPIGVQVHAPSFKEENILYCMKLFEDCLI